VRSDLADLPLAVAFDDVGVRDAVDAGYADQGFEQAHAYCCGKERGVG